MRKNTTKNRLQYWHIGILFYVLIFFFGLGIMANILNAKASPSISLATPANTPIANTPTANAPTVVTLSDVIPLTILPLPTPTPTPTPTTPPPTPTPTPTTPPPTPTPTPTTPPPTPTPTTPARQPTPPAAQPTPNDGVPPPTPTSTMTATATSTTTAGGLPPTTISIPPGQNPPNTQPPNPGSGSHTGGPNALEMSLGISTSGILLFGGGLFWLYSRRNSQNAAVLQKGQMSDLPVSNLWANNGSGVTSMGIDPMAATFAAEPAAAAFSPYTNNSAYSANKDMVSEAHTMQQPVWFSPEAGMGAAYRPEDLRPTTALPQSLYDQQASEPTPDVPASYMNPPSLDGFRLLPSEQRSSTPLPPVITPENLVSTSDMGQPQFDAFDLLAQEGTLSIALEQQASTPDPVIVPENLAPIQEVNAPTVMPLPNVPQSVTPGKLPDVAEDPSLLEIMRQAQNGLFIISDS